MTDDDMIKTIMKSHFLFFLFGIVLGTAVFWLPTALVGGGIFILPTLFFSGPWFLAPFPYLALFTIIFAVLAGIYRLLERKFAISFADGASILLGLYASLAIFFILAAHVISGGNIAL